MSGTGMHLREMITKLKLDRVYDSSIPEISAVDLQGWNSDDPVFKKVIDIIRPGQIIEVGSWKGASAIHMTKLARHHRHDVTTLCVDTFTGSNASLWTDQHDLLARDSCGFPTIYKQFLYNIFACGVSTHIAPLPVTSTCAAEVMQYFGVQADLIYIDGGHQEFEVNQDLIHYWPLLRPGGVMLGDDYSSLWPGVVGAVDRFAYKEKLPIQVDDAKWWFEKPERSRSWLVGWKHRSYSAYERPSHYVKLLANSVRRRAKRILRSSSQAER